MGIHGWEVVLIVVVVLILFGAGKLPSVFKSVGQGIREMKNAMEGKIIEEPKVEKTDVKNEEQKKS